MAGSGLLRGLAITALLGGFVAWLAHFVIDATSTNIDKLDLKGKRVLVCGASLGIGREVAREYASHGAAVAMAARSKDKLEAIRDEVKERLGQDTPIYAVPADLSSEEAAAKLIEQTVEVLGGLDIIVLSHISYAYYGDWLPRDNKTNLVQSMFGVNTFSYIYLSSHAMPYLAKSEGGGQVIVVSSFAGKVGVPRTAIYAGTKHALHGFYDSLRHELWAHKVPVSITLCVLGSIDTAAVTDLKSLIKGVRWASPVDTARAIIRGGALRKREIYYPFEQMYLPVLIRPFFPDTLDTILRSSIADPEKVVL